MAKMEKQGGNKAFRGNGSGIKPGKDKKKTATYSKAKEELKRTVKRTDHVNISDDKPEIAIEVIEEEIAENQTVKQAFIAEHLFRKTIEDAIPCGIAAVDNLGRQIYVNRTFCDMLGWNEKELIGASFPYVYWDAGDIAQFKDSYLTVATGAVPSSGVELPFKRRDGNRFWAWVLGSILYTSDGEPAGHLISIVDISRKREAEAALKQFSSQLVDALEKERRLISHDLHDSIGGRLAGIKYGIEKIIHSLPAELSKATELLNKLLQVVKATIDETRRISKNLHPSVIDDLGLKAALRDLVREFNVIYPAIKVNCSLEFDESLLPGQLKILAFRVCQEALTNIGRHSRAAKAVLRVHSTSDQVVLTIEDDGIGIASEGSSKGPCHNRGLGLLNMRERVELAGGHLEMHSRKGRGVYIKAVWPVG